MLALFWYSPVPHWKDWSRESHPAFFLEGETRYDIAWDLVDQFIDGHLTQHFLPGRGPGNELGGGACLMDASDWIPNMLRTQEYHDNRFTETWWNKHRNLTTGYFERLMCGADIPNVSLPSKTWYDGPALLDWYLEVILKYSYVPFHGPIVGEEFTPDITLEYLTNNTYLRWIRQDDPEAVGRLLKGNLRDYF